MITMRTVLILGAGVSQPFGFPSGKALCETVIANTRPGNALLRSVGYFEEDIQSFGNALFYSGRNSVDAFLEHQPKFTEVGKAAIAQALIQYERLDDLFTRKDNLYSYLFEQLSTSSKEFAKNRLSVLTFNYDRSFEQYMFTALQNSYGLDDADAADLVSSLNIIHLHGHLGLLPWQKKGDGGRRPYLNTVNEQSIREGSKGIKIIHEAADNDPGFEAARSLLSDAARIIFLGFGYAEANLKKLQIDPEKNPNQEFLGSVYEFAPAEIMTLRSRFSSRLNSSDNDWPRGYSALNSLLFLRSKVWLQKPV